MAMIQACGANRDRAASSVLRQGDVARVGDLAIPAAMVASVAAARAVGTREALGALIEDALLANAARARGDAEQATRWAQTAALSRRMLEEIWREAREKGPPSDDELATLTVIHLLVVRSTILSDEEARGTAGAIRDAVLGARGAADFERRASSVAHPHARVVVERLSPFTADGAMASGGSLDTTFVAAAFALRLANDISPVVETPFGWHVIMLLDRQVPDGETLTRRRAGLSAAVTALRARMAQREIFDSWRGHERVEVTASSAALMATVQTESE
jgi:hypothetical protein